MGSSVTDPWGIFSSILISYGLCAAVFLVWCLVRVRQRGFFAPKARLERPIAVDGSQNVRRLGHVLAYTLRCPETLILQSYGGIDQVLYLRFLKYSAAFFAAMSLFGLVVMIPINNAGTNKFLPSDAVDYTTGLDTLSLGNVNPGSNLLWAHIVFLYVFTAFALYMLYKFYQSSAHLKAQMPRAEQQTRSMMVHDLPSSRRGDEELYKYMAALHGEDRVTSAMGAPSVWNLRKLREERDKIYLKWAEVESVVHKTGKHPTTWTGPLPFMGRKVDKAEFFLDQLRKIDAKIASEMAKPRSGNGHGFVSFDTATSATLASQALHEPDNTRTNVEPGPDAADVYWRYLVWTRKWHMLGTLWAAGWLFLLFVFWTVPVGFIAGISNLDNLAKLGVFNWLIAVVNLNSFVKGFIQGFLASYALILFFALLPFIIRSILKPRGYVLRSKLDVGVLTVYWSFLLLNVLLVYAIAGSLLSNIQNLATGTPDIVALLATGIPAQATFFVNYITVATFKVIVLDESRLIPWLVYRAKRMFLIKTEFQKAMALAPVMYPFSKTPGHTMLVWCIGLTFSLLYPLILPFTAVYFATAYFWVRHNMIFACSARYQGINAVPRMVKLLGLGVLLFQLTMAGVLGLKQFPFAAFAILPIVLTIVFVWSYLPSRFARANKHIALSLCPQDSVQARLESLEVRKAAAPDVTYYTDPALLPLETTEDFTAQMQKGRYRMRGIGTGAGYLGMGPVGAMASAVPAMAAAP